MRNHCYFVYITTNKNKTVLYIGITNDLARRIWEHRDEASWLNPKSFAGRYNAYHLIFYEEFSDVHDAIAREKELKGWRREKKLQLINEFNPDWRFLEDEVEG